MTNEDDMLVSDRTDYDARGNAAARLEPARGWIITHKNDRHLCWNNTSRSWEGDDYDTFDETERATMKLPKNGEWEPVPWSKQD